MKFVILLSSVVCSINAIRLEPCALARLMLEEDVPRRQIGDWLCLIKYESAYHTQNKAAKPNGSFNYGLFAINDKIWCNSPRNNKDNRCGVDCSMLTDSNIADDIKCAMTIHRTMGFNAWKAWPRCRGRYNDRWLNECDVE